MARKKMPATKKKKNSKKRGGYTCGHCGESGHNARKCPKKGEKKHKIPTVKELKEFKAKTRKKGEDPVLDDVVKDVIAAGEAPGASKAAKALAKTAIKTEAYTDGYEAGAEIVLENVEKVKKKLTDLKDTLVEESFDLDGPQATAPELDPSVPPPGAKVKIPKRKKKRTKEQEAFWSASEKKLAPGAVAEASALGMQIPRISSGNFGLDVALYGGWPQGRICRAWGSPKSGKTGSLLNTVATYQREHCSECFQRECKCKNRDVPEVVWVDAENRMNSMLYWPEAHGINLDCLRILCPPAGQNVVDYVDHIVREQKIAKVGLVVVDSIAHIVSMDELNKPTLDGVTIGRSAWLMNQAWKRWTSAVHSLGIQNERKPTILCINQIRQKVGVMYGSPDVMPGGVGQDFVTSIDVKFRAGPPNYLVWKDAKEAEKKKGKKGEWAVKEKSHTGKFKPQPDQTPDFMKVNYLVTASGICPAGRYGEFNYWLKATHGHRCGDPDNGLQLWDYCKRYNLIEKAGVFKKLFGHEARTLGALQKAFREDPKAQAKARKVLMDKLLAA